MSMRVLEIGGERFLVGLEWFILTKKEASAYLKEKKPKKFVKITRNDYVNIGILPPGEEEEDPELLKLPVLAPALAEAKEGPWAGFFRVGDNLFYHIAVEERGFVLPSGEAVGSREQVHSVYLQNLEVLDEWKDVVSEGGTEDLYNLLLYSENRYYLSGSLLDQISSLIARFGKKRVLVAGSVVLSVFLVAGLSLFLKEEEVPQPRLNPAVIQQAFKQATAKPKETNEVSVFSSLPFLSECYRHVTMARTSRPGWKVSSVFCSTNGTVRIRYSRKQDSRIVFISSRMKVESTSAEEVFPLNLKLISTGSGENREVFRSLVEWASLWSGVTLTPPYLLIEEDRSRGIVQKKVVFEAGGTNPVALGYLARIRGVYLTEIELTSSGWRVKGIVEQGALEEEKSEANKQTN